MTWLAGVAFLPLAIAACDTPTTTVVLENKYPASAKAPMVVYQASWASVSFTTPLPPGAASDAMDTIPASSQLAYALVAPGWDVEASAPPSSFVVMQSRGTYELHLNTTLHIRLDDESFDGNCAAGHRLTADEGTFIATRIFPTEGGAYHYDAATCVTTWVADGGAP